MPLYGLPVFTDSDGIQFDGINSSQPWFEMNSALTVTEKTQQSPYALPGQK